jgi:TonB family protein
MRKAIDTLLFSGDFTPTTFNLAFFMHSLFREDIERESRMLKEEKESSYVEFIADEAARAAAARAGGAAAEGESTSVTLPPFPAPTASVAGSPPAAEAKPPRPEPQPRDSPAATMVSPGPLPLVYPPSSPAAQHAPATQAMPAPASHPSAPAHQTPPPARPAPAAAHHTPPARPAPPAAPQMTVPISARDLEQAPGVSAKEAAAGFTFHKDSKGARVPMLAGLALLAVLAAGGAYWLTKRASVPSAPPVTTPPTLSPEAQAAMLRVKELEDKLAALEAEKKAAEEKAAEDARKKVEAQAKARGQAVDPDALARAQEDERRKARAEQERKQQEEQKRLEEQKKAEEARIAEEQRKAEEIRLAEEAARLAAATATTTLPSPPPTTAEPEVKPGTLMNLNDSGVIAPLAERKTALPYPPLAQRQGVEGTVELSVLVDETGRVTDAKVVSGPAQRVGFNEAAIETVKRWKFRPATKNGVPVKVWLPVKVDFRLPK